MARLLGPLFAGLLLGLIVGAGSVWLLNDGADAGAASIGSSATRRANIAAAEELPAGAAPASVAAERRVARDEGELLPGDVAASVTALAKSVPAPSVEAGTKTVAGHVADPQGRPLEGVVVRALRQRERRPERGRRGEELAPIPTLEQRLRDAITAHRQALADQRETATGPDGAFRLEGLQDGDWRVSAGKEGFAFVATRDVVRPDATVDFRATLVVKVAVAVRLPDGRTPDEAALLFGADPRGGGRRPEAWRADQPWIALEPGTYELKASLGDPDSGPPWPTVLASEFRHVTVRADAPTAEVLFELKGAPGIGGRVVQAGDDTDTGLVVHLMPLPQGKEPDLNALAGSDKSDHVDPKDNRYVFRNLPPGRYLVGATRGWSPPIFVHAVVDVADAMMVQDLVLPPLDAASCIVARVFSPEGLPLDKVDFRFDVKNDDNEWANDAHHVRRGPGLYWVVPPRGDDESSSSGFFGGSNQVELTAVSPQFGTKSIDITGPGREVEIRFGEPATLVVTIPGYVGSGFEGRVHLALEHGRHERGRGRRFFSGDDDNALGADGRRTFGPVEAGPARLVMSIQGDAGHSWQSTRAGELDVDLRPGENSITFPIPALYAVTIEVPGVVGGGVQLSRVDRGANDGDFEGFDGINSEVDAQHRATFSGLPAGDYVISVWGGSDEAGGTMKLRIPAGGIVRFTPQVNDCLAVWVGDEQGKLAKAGFESGDQVIAIAGTALRDVKKDLEPILTASAAKESVPFTVRRGGRTVEIAFDVKAMLNPETLGGNLQPATRGQ